MATGRWVAVEIQDPLADQYAYRIEGFDVQFALAGSW